LTFHLQNTTIHPHPRYISVLHYIIFSASFSIIDLYKPKTLLPSLIHFVLYQSLPA